MEYKFNALIVRNGSYVPTLLKNGITNLIRSYEEVVTDDIPIFVMAQSKSYEDKLLVILHQYIKFKGKPIYTIRPSIESDKVIKVSNSFINCFDDDTYSLFKFIFE